MVVLQVSELTVRVGNEALMFPTISAAAWALNQTVKCLRKMKEEGLFAGKIPSNARVVIHLKNPLSIGQDGSNLRIDFAEKSASLPPIGQGYACYQGWPSQVSVSLPLLYGNNVDDRGCVVSSSEKKGAVSITLLNFPEIVNLAKFLEGILDEVNQFLESALQKAPVSISTAP